MWHQSPAHFKLARRTQKKLTEIIQGLYKLHPLPATLICIYTHVYGHINPSLDKHTVLSHQLNKYRVNVKVWCMRWSALPHHQHNYQLHTVVSHQDPQAITGHDNFISMCISHCTLCLSFCFPYSYNKYKYVHSPWSHLMLHTLNLPHIGLHSSSHCLISQISFTSPLPLLVLPLD